MITLTTTNLNIDITTSAQDYLRELLDKQGVEGIGVRLFVTQPGTPYAETCLAYCKPGESKETDLIIKLETFDVWIEAASEEYLEEGIVDYSMDRMGGQLTIKAPNAKTPKIGEDSPLDVKVNYFLTTEVNPGLAAHGGQVQLVEINEGMAVLQFGGGCQGCGMVDVTLKDGVEKTLKNRIPELVGVRDVTDHTNRENAFYT